MRGLVACPASMRRSPREFGVLRTFCEVVEQNDSSSEKKQLSTRLLVRTRAVNEENIPQPTNMSLHLADEVDGVPLGSPCLMDCLVINSRDCGETWSRGQLQVPLRSR